MTTPIVAAQLDFTEPPPAIDSKVLTNLQLFQSVRNIVRTGTLPPEELHQLADDVFDEMSHPLYRPTSHYSISTSRRGCVGPLCSRAAADRTRYYKRRQLALLGHEPAMDVGGRRPQVAERSRLLTQIACVIALVRGKKIPEAHIEACLIDRVDISGPDIFNDAHILWAKENPWVTNMVHIYGGASDFYWEP